LVVVSVTVVTEVVTLVVVDGVGASVVVGGAVVVGVTVVVTVVGGGGAAEVLGDGAAVSVGAADWLVGADDVVGVMLVEVTAGLGEFPAPVNFTIAYTSSASTAAVSTPRPTRAAGR
jgi:hypothetical protein